MLGLQVGGCESGQYALSPQGDATQYQFRTSPAGTNLRSHQSRHYVILYSGDEASARQTGRFLDQVYSRFMQSFSQAGFAPKAPGNKLVCVVLSSYQELDAYGREADATETSWMDGYYSFRTNRIAFVQPRGGGDLARTDVPATPHQAGLYATPSGASSGGLNLRTATHELAHQLAFNSGIQAPGAAYPFWVSEGLATNFEAGDRDRGGLGQKACVYRGRLVDVKRGGRLIALERFATMTSVPGRASGVTRDAYAQAWGLFQYLSQRRPREFRQYLAMFSGGQSQRGAFVAAFGPVASVERQFHQFIDQQTR